MCMKMQGTFFVIVLMCNCHPVLINVWLLQNKRIAEAVLTVAACICPFSSEQGQLAMVTSWFVTTEMKLIGYGIQGNPQSS